MSDKPKLLDRVRQVVRLKHYSYRSVPGKRSGSLQPGQRCGRLRATHRRTGAAAGQEGGRDRAFKKLSRPAALTTEQKVSYDDGGSKPSSSV